jgi:single-stranded-DNA-specific exonuclease
MKYTLLNDDITQPLLERILAIRNIQCDLEDFFDPSISHYRRDPYLLKGMDIAVDRILAACAAKEKITIFGDYDVDGIT